MPSFFGRGAAKRQLGWGGLSSASNGASPPVNGDVELESLQDPEAGAYGQQLSLLDVPYSPAQEISMGIEKGEWLTLCCPGGIPPGLRARVAELLSFAGWFIVGIPTAIQLPFLWYVFWQHVCSAGSVPPRDLDHLFARRALLLWLLWLAAVLYCRRVVHAVAPSAICAVLRNLELFTVAGLYVTMSANLCTFLHTPARPLYDLGFMLVPEQRVDSPWRPVSDVLAEAVPALLVLRSLCLRRPIRCQVLVSWLRCVALVYFLRGSTIPLTSLPGPAPHCMRAEGYHPPQGWHDIAIRMGPMVGDYTTCGDLIFSGHTSFTTMTMLCLVKTFQGRRGYAVASVLGFMYVASMCLLALAGRKHYTIDIAIAILVTWLTFHRFQDGWAARAKGGGLSDEQLRNTRKDTIDLPADEDLVLPTSRQGWGASRLLVV
eukprot:TRINITY_DN2539_c0_g2_i1.p1 TRINITY_DN2539_c0_g2~~TRINITY_DN2539_c0_g2_i1.p1  ORF type:complete len:431 (-),score=121.65 TRINITY_DN2539_c0_g2_i1:648-1940(-)